MSDGVIALVSNNTTGASGAKWEVKCAREEGKRTRGIYVTTTDRPSSLPAEFEGVPVISWTWDNIKTFVESL